MSTYEVPEWLRRQIQYPNHDFERESPAERRLRIEQLRQREGARPVRVSAPAGRKRGAGKFVIDQAKLFEL